MAIYKEEMKKDSVRIVNDVFWYSMTMFTMDQQFQKSQVSGDFFVNRRRRRGGAGIAYSWSQDVSLLSDPCPWVKEKTLFLNFIQDNFQKKSKTRKSSPF